MVLRIGNHCADGYNFFRDKGDFFVSIFIGEDEGEHKPTPIPYKEFYCSKADFDQHPEEVVKAVLMIVKEAIDTGEVEDYTGFFTMKDYPKEREFTKDEVDKIREYYSQVKESAKWIPIQDFNKQIKKENTMKFKRYIRESNGSLDKREQIKNGMIYSYISNNEGLIQTMVDGMVNEIKEVGTILGTHALREKWFKTYTDNGVCVPFDNYIFVINDVGEWYVFEKDCKNREDFILGWHPDIGYREFSELNRGDYFDRALDIFANFENIESTFDKWVEKKLNEY